MLGAATPKHETELPRLEKEGPATLEVAQEEDAPPQARTPPQQVALKAP